MGTRGLASPIEEDLSFKTGPRLSISHCSGALFGESDESFEVDSDSRVRPGPASPWTRESQLTALIEVHVLWTTIP